jgi:hypothetical protein
MDIEQISKMLRDESCNYHKNLSKLFEIYLQKKFIVTNRELKRLRENYYIDLAKHKLKDGESKWGQDQLKSLESYLTEKNKIDSIVKKDIASYKLNLEEIDKKYFIAYNNYKEQLDLCKNLKGKLDNLAENKNGYEKIIESFKNQLYHFKLMNSMSSLKGISVNYGFNNDKGNKKKEIIENEIIKMNKKLDLVSNDLKNVNTQLLENVI